MLHSNPPPLPHQQASFNANQQKNHGGEAYSFAAEPQTVQQRKKYRDPSENDPKGQ